MKKLLKMLVRLLLTISICLAPLTGECKSISNEDKLRAVLGEGENQGALGMKMLSSAIDNRGTLDGVYGVKNIVKKNGEYFRKTADGLKKIDEKIVKQAKQAINKSKNIDFANGADHWENTRELGIPYWAKSMEKVAVHKDHTFYKSKKRE